MVNNQALRFVEGAKVGGAERFEICLLNEILCVGPIVAQPTGSPVGCRARPAPRARTRTLETDSPSGIALGAPEWASIRARQLQ
jgi:hypothetical protein